MKMTMIKTKILILIASVALIILAHGPLSAGEINDITLDVTGMTCKLCPKMVKKAISNVDGVEEVKVSYKEKEASVKYDLDETGVEEIISAVEKAGYGAKEIKGD